MGGGVGSVGCCLLEFRSRLGFGFGGGNFFAGGVGVGGCWAGSVGGCGGSSWVGRRKG